MISVDTALFRARAHSVFLSLHPKMSSYITYISTFKVYHSCVKG